MSRHHIDFVTFDLAGKDDLGLTIDDPLTELLDHGSGVAGAEVEFLGDLQAGQVQAHEIQANDPDSQRLVMAGEDGVGEVVEALPTGMTLVTLPLGWVSSRPFLMTRADEQCGQVTPSGQRMVRTVSKHLASSMRSRMFTMNRSLVDTGLLRQSVRTMGQDNHLRSAKERWCLTVVERLAS